MVLHELAAGRTPFVGSSIDDTLHRIQHADAPSLASGGVDVPEPFQHIVDRCLAKSRDDRYATAAELRDALLFLRRALGDSAGEGGGRSLAFDLALQGMSAMPPPATVRDSDILINCAMFDDLPLAVDWKG